MGNHPVILSHRSSNAENTIIDVNALFEIEKHCPKGTSKEVPEY
jgi:hypothetical protein